MSDIDINNINSLKVLVIGDCQVGKTSLLLKYLLNEKYETTPSTDNSNKSIPTVNTNNNNNNNNDNCNNNNNYHYLYSYKPTSLSMYKCQVNINSISYTISFTDTNGNWQNEKYSDLRRKYYFFDHNVDVVMLCFSLVDRNSFLNITKKWYPEIRQHYSQVPIILIGTKYDLKHDYKQQEQMKYNSKTHESHTNKCDSSTGAYQEMNETIASSSSSTSTLSAKPIKRKECKKLKKLLNAQKYIQSSCFDDKQIKKTMDCVIKYALKYHKDKLKFFYTNPNIKTSASFSSLNTSVTSNTYNYDCHLKTNNKVLLLNDDKQKQTDTNTNTFQIKSSQFKCLCCTTRSETLSSFYEK